MRSLKKPESFVWKFFVIFYPLSYQYYMWWCQKIYFTHFQLKARSWKYSRDWNTHKWTRLCLVTRKKNEFLGEFEISYALYGFVISNAVDGCCHNSQLSLCSVCFENILCDDDDGMSLKLSGCVCSVSTLLRSPFYEKIYKSLIKQLLNKNYLIKSFFWKKLLSHGLSWKMHEKFIHFSLIFPRHLATQSFVMKKRKISFSNFMHKWSC